MVNTESLPIKVLHITDMHLFEDVRGALGGIATDATFASVWAQVKARHGDARLIVSTGDIAQESVTSVYERASARFSELPVPVYAVPGNHDCVETLYSGGWWANDCAPHALAYSGWTVLFLNSAVPGKVYGSLGEAQLNWIGAQLKEAQERNDHVLICMHHHPVPMGCEWLDNLGVRDDEAFWRCVDAVNCVRGVLWGHVHQHFDQMRGDIRLMASPSTGFQFAARRDDFKLDEVNPGYRWLELNSDGSIESEIERLEGVTLKPDMSLTGY